MASLDFVCSVLQQQHLRSKIGGCPLMNILLKNLIPFFVLTWISICTAKEKSRKETYNDKNERGGQQHVQKKRIAIIGGGISGTFAAKYLSEYDKGKCKLDSVVLFDPYSSEGGLQGGRIKSLLLDDGTFVELGASIIFSGNKLTKEVVDADPNLISFPPHMGGGKGQTNESLMPQGFGIWNGYKFSLLTSNTPKKLKTAKILYRYNLDLIKLSRAVSRAVKSFDLIYKLLDSDHPRSFFRSPDDIWESTGLLGPSRVSFDEFLDSIGISKDTPSWMEFWGQGNLRKELTSAVNLSNYNQNNTELNGLAGLVSFVPTKGDLFSIQGGNEQIPLSAFRQAREIHYSECKENHFRHEKKVVTSVVSTMESMELWSEKSFLGEFDVVILAAPLQQCRVSFFRHSHVDRAVLVPLPLHGIAKSEMDGEKTTVRDETLLLPSSATRSYRQTITTVVRNATLQLDHFQVRKKDLPKSVYFTDEGRNVEHISSITQITSDGVFKMFTSTPVREKTLRAVFGKDAEIVSVKVWGGKNGGAYPDFNGGGEASVALPFLLHDEGKKALRGGFDDGPALFYTNAMETSVACIEISAIGAKAVAKLVSKRLGLLSARASNGTEEL